VDLPLNYDKSEFERIKQAAERIKKHSDAMGVIGLDTTMKEYNLEKCK
jgi:glucose-6-phosphate isomerase